MKYNIIVKAKNSKVRSSLLGVFFPYHDSIMFTYHVEFHGGSRSDGNMIFSDIYHLVDYLMDDCGCDFLYFKKL